MKSAYELAMERLEKQAPSPKITDEQRAAIAEIDSNYKAKIAEREVFLQSQLQKATAAGQAVKSRKSASSFRAKSAGCRRNANTKKRKREVSSGNAKGRSPEGNGVR